MFRSVLIANRGEIACRVVRTCRRLGIRAVAVYSDADAGALHVRLADTAVRIGPADAASSYLDAEAVVDAARRSGAEAIHPGYGFLSERAVLPELCAANGIGWIGPHAEAIRRMGSKIESKRIAREAGVPCVPGYQEDAQDDAAFAAAAERIGYPVLIKASAGGGGRGMRRVARPDDLAEALASARAEAKAGFGDPALLLEKLIERPRHIEVQLAGDKYGNLVHLFERECSIQRYYQKVIEEAPAPNLSDETRARLYDAALRLGRAIGYDSLGTVEFLLDAGAKGAAAGPWFLEMNTRLQVEHPVTEEITGLDLVEWQIRIAAGEPLPLPQDRIVARGAAIEARLNAEDPAADYRPCLGTVVEFAVEERPGLRVDTGIAARSAVTPHYDSLLAKVIGFGADRAAAANSLSAGLGDLALLGVGSNQEFLRVIVDHPLFRNGAATTRFLGEAFPDGWHTEECTADVVAAAAAWAEAQASDRPDASLGPWAGLGGFRVLAPAGRPARVALRVEAPGGPRDLELTGGAGRYAVSAGDELWDAAVSASGGRVTVDHDGRIATYRVAVEGSRVHLACDGRSVSRRVAPRVDWLDAGEAGGEGDGGGRVVATLPGLVSSVAVEPGQAVAKGETVVVLEAMKLLHALPAPVAGRVAAILCAAGQTVAAGAALVEIEPDAVVGSADGAVERSVPS